MNTIPRRSGNTRSATTTERQGTQHPIFQINSKETPDNNQDEEKSRTSRSSKYSRFNKSDINNLKKAIKNSFKTSEEKKIELENEDSDLTS